MRDVLQTEADHQALLLDAMVMREWPDATIQWGKEDPDTETRIIQVRNNGRRHCIKFSYEALAALDDAFNLPRIQAAVRTALQRCEAGAVEVTIWSDWLGHL